MWSRTQTRFFACQYSTLTEAIFMGGIDPDEIAAVGITNQRETTVVWGKSDGKAGMQRHCGSAARRTSATGS